MYPISTAFQQVLDSRTGRNRTIVWWGTLTLVNGTIFELTTDNFVQGSGTLSSACELPCIGNTPSVKLESQLIVAVEPRLLKDAEVVLYVRLTSPAPADTWEEASDFFWSDLKSTLWGDDPRSVYVDIPMGVFTVLEAKRAINSIKIEAHDRMLRFDTDLPRMDTNPRTPFEWARLLCDHCSVEFGMTNNQIRELSNGSRNLTYADVDSDVKTCRDLLSHLAATLCCIAAVDRGGKLVFTPYGSEAVAEITPDNRFSSEFADYQSYYTGIQAQYKAKALQEYYKNCGALDDDGLIVDLGSNVFLQVSNDSNRAASIQAIIDTFKDTSFTPFDVSVPFNPAFDLLDILAFSGGHTPENCYGPVTSITRKIGGAMTLQCDTPATQTNPTRETVQVDGLSALGTLTGTVYASSDFWIMINAFPNEETVIGDDTLTTELIVNCTVDNTCAQIAWTGAYYLDEDATVTVKILVDDEVIYQIADDQTAGNHVMNVTTGHNIDTQGEHVVKVILREDVA